MSNIPPKILLTGFGPFPGVSVNPCTLVLKAAQKAHANKTFLTDIHVELKTLHLDTVWKKAPRQLATVYSQWQPDVMIHLGYADSSIGFRLEKQACNVASNVRDAVCDLPPTSRVINGGPASIVTKVNIHQIEKALHKAELSAEISKDAGTYLCNMIYFYGLNFALTAQSSNTTSLFIHIPPLRENGRALVPSCASDNFFALNLHQFLQGLEIVVQEICCDGDGANIA